MYVEVGHFKPLPLEFTTSVQDSFVLRLDSDDVFTLGFIEACRSLDGQVIRLGSAGSPYYLARIGANQCRYIYARFLYCRFRLPAPSMASGSWIAKVLT